MTNLLVTFVAMIAIWPFGGGGKDYHMTASSQVPAASGTVKVTQNKDNGNTQVDIKVRNLAKPASLTPPAAAYIVWIRPRGENAVKQAAIGVGNDLNGELKAATVSKDFDLFITAEQGQLVTAPTGPELLKVHINVT
ncbi:MAG TPA: hypothetical protein VHC90_05025 [Bryobacteraceae bacterium]|nr:hypothetical protein [Bryobacteraceae bacterium]